jgi:1-acyl-sn-glycerol-3-phosphate acyltransferase
MVEPSLAEVEERVLAIARELVRETSGQRAALAATKTASLERDLGLGSLERVELIARVERELGRALDEGAVRLDSPAELARAALAGALGPIAAAAPRLAPASLTATRLRLSAATVHEALWRRAEAEPERPQTYMREDDGREHTISYGALLDRARAIGGSLRQRGIRRGDAVALMLPTGFDFLSSFQGILIAGAVPVPIYPPVRLDRLAEYAERQSAILRDSGAACLVTFAKAKPIGGLLRESAPGLTSVVTAEELADCDAPFEAPLGAPDDPAFIQYTSGSTGHPKGVLLTHANLLANVQAIAAGLLAQPDDVGVSWLPLYHDMGLIGSWLFCLHEGLPIDIQSPLSFLARPERWLWAIHQRRGTLSGAPNFAYELCVRRIPDEAIEGLDLSSWRCALNGAEPVSPETLERFARRFAPYGFRREAMMPVFGLAENSVALCFPPPGRGPRVDRVRREAFERSGRAEPAASDDLGALRFVSSGAPLPGHQLRLLDDAGRQLGERVVGRLAFRGPSATAGYFKNPEATAAITLADGFLDSGDLAYLADGELYVCGRRKDIIIKGGRNYVPQEIEEAAAAVAGVRRGCVVAIGVPQPALGTESLVLVAETRATAPAERDRIAAAVIESVAAAVGVPPDQVELVAPGAVPKTSSGKVRRAAARQMHLAGTLGRSARLPLARQAALLCSAALQAARPRLEQAIRLLYVGLLAAALLLPTLAIWLLGALLPPGRPMRALERGFLKFCLRLAGFRLSVTGQQHLAGPGPYVLACNHASYADIAALQSLVPREFLFVAKREILAWPLVGLFIRKGGHLTVERFDARESAADAGKIAQAIERGFSVLVFPEGTFTSTAGLRPFRLGAFKTAALTGTPVVPLALRGTRRALRDGSWIPRPGKIELRILPPVLPLGTDWRQLLLLRDRVADAVAQHCGEPRLDIVAGGPVRG